MTDSETFIIGRQFEAVALATPDRAAIVFPEMEYSYGMLWALTKAFAVRMSEHGVDQSATVQLETADLPVMLASLLATSLLGARFAERTVSDELAVQFPVTHRFYVDTSPAPSAAHVGVIDESWSPAELTASQKSGDAFCTDLNPEMPWLLVTTSGTTGVPKVVGLSQRMVIDRSRAVSDEFQPGKTRFASLFPCSSRPFFARAMGALLNGATIVERGDWAFWTQAGVNRVSGSLAQVKSLQEDSIAGPTIAVVEVSGAKLRDSDARELLERFDLVDDTYGATETSKSFSNFITLASDGSLKRTGAPRDSIIEIVNASGTECGPLQEGEVRVRNAYIANTYLSGAIPGPVAQQGGWFYPGDMARWGHNGTLDILLRKNKNVLSFDGVKLNASILDSLMTEVDGILEAATFESPKEGSGDIIAFVVFAPDCNRPQIIELARKACADALGAKFAPTKIWPLNTIPRRADGSTDREKCASLILQAIQQTENPCRAADL
jgi:acyl-CoA synthetase (AMP-forming)/AMP-acid ligase II